MKSSIKIWLVLLIALCTITGIAQQIKQVHELDFQFTNQYRNINLNPTWPVYSQNYKSEPLNAPLPRFETLNIKGDSIRISRNSKGIQLNSSGKESKHIFKKFPRIQAPCVLVKLEVSEYSQNQTIQLGFAKDEYNYAILNKIENSGNNEFRFELEQENEKSIIETFKGIDTQDEPCKLYFFLGNDDFRFMIETCNGLQHIGIVSEKRTCFTRPEEIQGYSPAFGVELHKNAQVSIGKFCAGYFEGIGHDFRSVTYENGDPIRNENGNFYISTSSRFMGKNGGSGGICVYEMDSNGRIDRPVSLIVAKNNEWIEAGTAAKLVFDRDTKQWLYVARAFPSPGGMLHIGKTKENLLNYGLHLIDCKKHEGIVGNSLDGDLIKIKDTWYIAYHGGHPRKLHIAKSQDLKNWDEISATKTGEGISIAKKNKDYFIIDATSPTQMNVRKMFSPSEIVGTIELSPSPGNHREHGGFPWGCIIPVKNEDSMKYLMVCFSMDEYMENTSGGIFTYGDIFSYSSEEE